VKKILLITLLLVGCQTTYRLKDKEDHGNYWLTYNLCFNSRNVDRWQYEDPSEPHPAHWSPEKELFYEEVEYCQVKTREIVPHNKFSCYNWPGEILGEALFYRLMEYGIIVEPVCVKLVQ